MADPPSDHKAVWARLQVNGVQFTVATANVRDTPRMPLPQATACVHRVQGIAGVTVSGFNEFQRRHLSTMLNRGWKASQPTTTGDKARAPIGYDPTTWTPAGPPQFRQYSARNVATKLGAILVPSGNRYATEQILDHDGVRVGFVSYHSIAHVNVGAHFGYTGKGPKVLLKLRGKLPNPAIAVFKQGMTNLEKRARELAKSCDAVVLMGDWNWDAFADMKAKHPEPLGVRKTLERLGADSIYSTGRLKTGTAGSRGIDYIAVMEGTR